MAKAIDTQLEPVFSKRHLEGDWYEIRLVVKQPSTMRNEIPDAEIRGPEARRKWMVFMMWGASGIAEALSMPMLSSDCAAVARAIDAGRIS